MNITLARNNEPAIDITRYLDNSYAVTVRQEIERKAFQRAVGDTRLRLGDLDNSITNIFSNQPPTTAFRVDVYDAGRRFFFGFIDNDTVDFSIKSRWMECDVFSANKRFFDKAKAVRVCQVAQMYPQDYMTLEDLFAVEVQALNLSENQMLFRGVNLGEYAQRRIRWIAPANAPIGLEGMFSDLHPETTIDELLKAMAFYYNAEFFIDPVTTDLVMQRRGAKGPGRRSKVIEDYLCDDVEPHVIWLDGQRIDYLYTYAPAAMHVSGPTFTSATAIAHSNMIDRWQMEIWPGIWYYIMTCFIGGKEGIASLPVRVVLPPTPSNATGWQVRLYVPPGPPGTTARQLYRCLNTPIIVDPTIDQSQLQLEKYHAVPFLENEAGAEIWITDNVGKNVVDTCGALYLGNPLNVMPENIGTFANQWVRYNEATGLWEEPIYNFGNNTSAPSGIVLDALPQLRFLDHVTRDERTYDPYDVFSFFDRDNDFTDSRVTEQWEPAFRSERKLTCKLNTVDIAIGDELTTGGKPSKAEFSTAKSWIVRVADNDLIDKTTTVEAVAE